MKNQRRGGFCYYYFTTFIAAVKIPFQKRIQAPTISYEKATVFLRIALSCTICLLSWQGGTHSRRNAAAPAAIFLCAECVPPQFPSSDHRAHRVLIFLKFPVGTVHRMSRRRLMVGRLFALAVLVDGRVIVDFLSLFLRHRIRLRNGR